MKLAVYQGEVFKRGLIWYGALGILVVGLCILSLWGANFAHGAEEGITFNSVLNTLILVGLVVGYWWYVKNSDEKPISLHLEEHGIRAGDRFFGYGILQGFVLEVDIKTKDVKNIVLIFEKKHHIYTIRDSIERIEIFVEELEKKLPHLDQFEQTSLEKVMRKCKL